MKQNLRTYQELIQIPTYIDRFRYLKIGNGVGEETFGFDRWMNQRFYNSHEWRNLRNHIITRDNGCDMAFPDREIEGKIYIHHMNPIEKQDIYDMTDFVMNPMFLVCVAHNTHNAIHYGSEDLLDCNILVQRAPNDTCPWK